MALKDMNRTGIEHFTLRFANPSDVPLIVELIQGLADYEKLSHECIATEELLRHHLFGERAYAEVLIGEFMGDPVGFALYFHTFSTFLARPGIYLEDLFVKPEWRSRGFGRVFLQELASIALERGCGRLEWAVLDWNEPAIRFYRRLGALPLNEWTTFRLTGEQLRVLAAGRGDAAGDGDRDAGGGTRDAGAGDGDHNAGDGDAAENGDGDAAFGRVL